MRTNQDLTGRHVLIVGPTGSGKTHALKYVLNQTSGEIHVLDPHNSPKKWPQNCQVHGGARNFNEIHTILELALKELQYRAEQLNKGVTDFEPLILALDEQPSLVSNVDNAEEAFSTISREGRKFGIFLYVATQSDRVKTLGITGEGDVRDNFAKVTLPTTIKQDAEYKTATVTIGTHTSKIKIPWAIPAPREIKKTEIKLEVRESTPTHSVPTPLDVWKMWTPKNDKYAPLKRVWQAFTTATWVGPYALLKIGEYKSKKKA